MISELDSKFQRSNLGQTPVAGFSALKGHILEFFLIRFFRYFDDISEISSVLNYFQIFMDTMSLFNIFSKQKYFQYKKHHVKEQGRSKIGLFLDIIKIIRRFM